MKLHKLAYALAALSLVLAPPMGPLAVFGSGTASAEGTQADSDDYNCHHGAPDDPITVYACSRLRGHYMSPDAIAAERQGGHQRDSDDWRCHHGRPDAWRTRHACARLRGEIHES